MRLDKNAKIALENGRAHADEILALRRKAPYVRRAAAAAPAVAAARAARGLLVAEGDSWFAYAKWACNRPKTDICKLLEARGFRIESVAESGTTIEDMAYSDGEIDEFCTLIEKQLQGGIPIQAIILSGGGNDVVQEGKFRLLLNHARSPSPGLNEPVLKSLIDEKLRNAYLHLIGRIGRLFEQFGQPLVPIVVHGYDYPIPDGVGHCWGLAGPWMGTEFEAQGYGVDQLDTRADMAKQIIDRFNAMLSGLSKLPGLAHVAYAKLSGTLPATLTNYRQYWENELHPTPQGFEMLAERFVQVLDGLPPGG